VLSNKEADRTLLLSPVAFYITLKSRGKSDKVLRAIEQRSR